MADLQKSEVRQDDECDWFSWSTVTSAESHRLQAIDLLLGHDERLLRFIFNLKKPELRRDPGKLMVDALSLSHSEALLVRLAMDFWNGGGCTLFDEVLSTLDPRSLIRFVRALCHLKELRYGVMHALIDDENGGFCL